MKNTATTQAPFFTTEVTMRTLKLLALLSLIWLLAACGSVEDVPLETLGPPPCSDPFAPPSETCPWRYKYISWGNGTKSSSVSDVAAGPDKSVYVLGSVFSFNPNTDLLPSQTGYLRKYSKYGSVLWTISFSRPFYIYSGLELEVDAQGNSYILEEGSSKFSSDLSHNAPYTNYKIVALRKYNPNGLLVWSKVLANAQVVLEEYHEFVDLKGHLTLTAGGWPVAVTSRIGNYHIHVFNGSGQVVGYYGVTNPINGIVSDIATSLDGNIYLVGDNYNFEETDICCGGNTAFLYVFNSAFTQVGTLFWAGGVSQIEVDSSNNIFVLQGSYLKKFKPNLTTAWEVHEPESVSYNGFTVDASKNVYTYGSNTEGCGYHLLCDSVYLAKLDGSSGMTLWSQRTFDNTSYYSAQGAVAANDYVYIVGDAPANDPDPAFLFRYSSSGTPR
jgi:hypothetical protein